MPSNSTTANTTGSTAKSTTTTTTLTQLNTIPDNGEEITVVTLSGQNFFRHAGYGCPFGYEKTRRNLDWKELPRNAIQTPEECAVRCLATTGCTSFQYHQSPCIDSKEDTCHCKYFWFDSACIRGCDMEKKDESISTYGLFSSYVSAVIPTLFMDLNCKRGKYTLPTSESKTYQYLTEQVPVPIDCSLRGWEISNSSLRCGVFFEGRDNVMQVSDGGSWSFAAVTFSVPENTFVTIRGDFWLRSLKDMELNYTDGIAHAFRFCNHDNLALKVPYCSPSLAVAQHDPDDKFYLNNDVLQTAKPKRAGWSSFSRTFKTKPNSSEVTVYLMQEWQGPLSASYFANLEVIRDCIDCVPPERTRQNTSLREEVPVAINCDLQGWMTSNALMRCGIEHDERANVLEILDDGEWSFAAVTFDVPGDVFVTVKGYYWLRSLADSKLEYDNGKFYDFTRCDLDSGGLKVPYCSPSVVVAQGEFDDTFYWRQNTLESVQPEQAGWSPFARTFRTKPNSDKLTVYLLQEASGPFSQSYFADLEIKRECGNCLLSSGTRLHCAAAAAEAGRPCWELPDCDCSGCPCMDSRRESSPESSDGVVVVVVVTIIALSIIIVAVVVGYVGLMQAFKPRKKKTKKTTPVSKSNFEDNLRSVSLNNQMRPREPRSKTVPRDKMCSASLNHMSAGKGRTRAIPAKRSSSVGHVGPGRGITAKSKIPNAKKSASIDDGGGVVSGPRYDADLIVARRLFGIHLLEKPRPPLPVATRTFRTSNFRKFYAPAKASGQPRNAGKLLVAVESLIRAFTKRRNIREMDADGGLELLYDEAWSKSEDLRSDVAGASVYFWTSAKRIGGFKFCGILNDALRRDDPSDLVYAIVVVRGINMITNASTLGRSTDSQEGLDASRKGINEYILNRHSDSDFDKFVPVCYRGAGFNNCFQSFYTVNKKFRVPSFVATSVVKAKAVASTARTRRPLSKILWEIRFDPRGEYDPVYRCKHDSAFTIQSVRWVDQRGAGSANAMHNIVLLASRDNRLESEDLPLAPWI